MLFNGPIIIYPLKKISIDYKVSIHSASFSCIFSGPWKMTLVEAEQCPNFITTNTVLVCITAILGYVSSIKLLGYRDFSWGCRVLGTGKKRINFLFC